MQKYKRLKVYFYQLDTMFVSRFGICNDLRQFLFTLTVFFFVCFPVRFLFCFPLCFVRSLFFETVTTTRLPNVREFRFFCTEHTENVRGRRAGGNDSTAQQRKFTRSIWRLE